MTSPVRQLFGTDGIRGIAGEFPLTLESTFLIGRALGHDLAKNAKQLRVVIGQDTRESSHWIADRVLAGRGSGGGGIHNAGGGTTPRGAFLGRAPGDRAAGVRSALRQPPTATTEHK